MKKTLIFVISSIVLLTCSLASCNKQKSLQERLQEEKRAISRYIDRERLVILDEYPKDRVFKDKEFYKIQSEYGVMYMHVVDSGNGRRPGSSGNEVTVRFEYRHDIAVSDSSILKWSTSGFVYPYSFKYGLGESYSVPNSMVCVGWVFPLSYVGEHAVVDLLIPSAVGSYSDNSNINPVFYKGLTYTNFY
jgi:hypothetical protein